MTTSHAPDPTGPSTVAKATVGASISTIAWALAGATTPDQVGAALVAWAGDAATWLVPNDAEHPRWYRRAAKACVSAASTGVAAVVLALGQWEGEGGDLSIAGVYLQLSSADLTTLGLLAARTALVALIPNTTAADPTLEREAVDVPAPVGANLTGTPIGEDEDGASVTGYLPVVPETATPSDLLALQRQADAMNRPRRLVRQGRHESAHEGQR